MSEYQYYEFLALDGPISDEGFKYARGCSSRAEVSRTRWVNTYEYGDFRGSVDRMLKYYDAHFYFANWGTVDFALAYPKNILPGKAIKAYLWEDGGFDPLLTLKEKGDRFVLRWSIEGEPSDYWVDGEGCIDVIRDIRDELLQGDYRALFLGWLADFNPERLVDSDERERIIPSIPAGLDRLTKAQKALIKHFEVDADALGTAAELCTAKELPSLIPMESVLAKLSAEEMRSMLDRVAQGSAAAVVAELKRMTVPEVPTLTAGSMTCQEFADRIADAIPLLEKKRAEAAEAARQKKAEQRRKHLESVLQSADKVWAGLHTLLERTASSVYDEAAKQLEELRDAYAQAGDQEGFEEMIKVFRERYSDRPAMLRRIKKL